MDPEKLASAFRARDPVALQELVELYGDRLLRSAALLCGNEADAQDLVQDTFVEAIRSAHRFRGRSTVYTWLHGILLNLTRHYHRSRKRIIYAEEAKNGEMAAEAEEPARADLEVASAALSAALRRLSAPHREVLVLRYYEHLKLHEIAALLEISKGTVKSRLHYAIEELQKLLPDEMNLFGGSGTKRKTEAMNCEHFQDCLYEYVEETLSSDQRADAEKHLADCDTCREAVRSEQRLAQFLSHELEQNTASLRLNADVRRGIVAAFPKETHTSVHVPTAVFANLRFARPLAIAASVLVIGLCVSLFLRSHESKPSPGPSSREAHQSPAIHVSYVVSTYTFRKEGDFVIDALTYTTNVVHQTLWAEDQKRSRQNGTSL